MSYFIVISSNQNVHGEVHFGYDNILGNTKLEILLTTISYLIFMCLKQNVHGEVCSGNDIMLRDNQIIYFSRLCRILFL